MNITRGAYWLTTGLFAFALGAGGLADLLYVPAMAESMAHLGYGEVFTRILGAWKVLGVLALLAPGLPRLKEWAYAGFTFSLTGASLSHLGVGDGVPEVLVPLVLLGVAAASYALRPESRRFRTHEVTRAAAPRAAQAPVLAAVSGTQGG